MSKSRSRLGQDGEQLAADYLLKKGYRIIERNHRSVRGEIDIIARDGETHVFVEVKSRLSGRYGSPLEAVTHHKQEHLARAALGFLTRHDLLDEPARFDVVGVDFSTGTAVITHIVGAFEVPA